MRARNLYAAVMAIAVFVTAAESLANGRRVTNSGRSSFQSPCGNLDQVSHRLGSCMNEIFDLVEGRFEEPKNDADFIAVCARFSNTEKCARLMAKDCLTGLPKTTTSAVASAIKRFRTSECKDAATRSKYKNAYSCVRKGGSNMAAVYRNQTAIGQAIRDLPRISPEEKIIKICCLLNLLDKELEHQYSNSCPSETPLLMGIVHAMTDDARNTLCRNPKCDGALNSVIRSKYKPGQNFMEPVIQIMFLLGTD